MQKTLAKCGITGLSKIVFRISLIDFDASERRSLTDPELLAESKWCDNIMASGMLPLYREVSANWMRNPRIINAEIVGIFNAADWLEEGDGLCISARITRATWLRKRRVFAQRIEASGASRRLWLELTGLPRASVLLLGYSIEMYLKAGLVKAYRGCREELFSHDLMRNFKHNLLKLASEIDFPNTQQNEQNFTELQELIKGGARYPITPEDVMGNDAKASRNRFSKQIRERNALIWSDDRFRQLCALSAFPSIVRIKCRDSSVRYPNW
jgi:hypothetical protein